MAEEINLTTEIIRNLSAIIAAVGSVVTAIGVILVGYWAYKTKQQSTDNAAVLTEQTAMLKDVDVKVDGMTTALVTATAGQNLAEGKLAERDAERAHLADSAHSEDDPLAVKLVKNK